MSLDLFTISSSFFATRLGGHLCLREKGTGSLLKNCPSFCRRFLNCSFLQRSFHLQTSKDSYVNIFVWCGILSRNGSSMKAIFRQDIHYKVSGLLVNQFFTKYFSLPARRKLLTLTFQNKFCTSGCTSFNWCIGTIPGKFPLAIDRRMDFCK